jgi:hypothetical protein
MLIAIAITFLTFSCTTSRNYHERLVAGAEYAYEQPSVSIQFTYAGADHPELVALRERYDLDLVAGDGSDVEQMVRLLEWAYNITAWDGSAPWPEGVLSAQGIIDWCEARDTGVNCRMKAIVLAEALLSVGIPARIVGCTPMDPEDRDSHVLVTAWSAEVQRWLWLDPSFYAWPISEDGRHLGIREVREMLIARDLPALNPQATINGRSMDARWYFGTYMTKNLYGLVSPLHSEPGREGSGGEKYEAILLHEGLLPRDSDDRARAWEFRGGRYTQHAISNPDVFWAAPVPR